jgi:hypothetical protein
MAVWLIRFCGHGEFKDKFLSDWEGVDGNTRITGPHWYANGNSLHQLR